MRNGFRSHHYTSDGKLSGGVSFGTGITISWQRGELFGEPNGAFVEDVIDIALDRLKHHQPGQFLCKEYAEAVSCLEAALKALEKKSQQRQSESGLGVHAPELAISDMEVMVSLKDTEAFQGLLSTALILHNALEFYEISHDGGQYAREIRANTGLVLEALTNSSANSETSSAEQGESQEDMLSKAIKNLEAKSLKQDNRNNEQSKLSVKPTFEED